MAGAGYKLFATGDVLTAAQVNTYLMQQTVMVFASATARNTALSGVLAEGLCCYLTDTNDFQIYDGSTWVSYGSGDITGVTASSPLTGGGTSGTVTVGIQDGTTAQKGAVQLTDSTSSTSTTTAATPNSVKSAYDLANGAIPKTLTTTTGDLIYASSANTPARLAIGSSNQVLTVSGGIPTWATAASGGGMTLINSGGTSLSGTTTTVSSIPNSYKALKIIIRGAKPQSIDTVLALRLNGDTGNNYYSIWQVTSGSTGQTFGSNYYNINTNGLSNDTDAQYNSTAITIHDYATTTNYKSLESLDFGKYAYAGATQNWGSSLRYGAWASASAITSISIIVSGTGGAVAGTVYVYGVN